MKALRTRLFPFSLFLLFPVLLIAQNTAEKASIFPKSLSFTYGYGSYAVKDEFFSEETYSGGIPLVLFEWSRMHAKYGYRMGLEFRNSSKISNYTMNAHVVEFSLSQDFLYPVGGFTLFKKEVFAFTGPGVDFFFYYNQQKFAESGLYFDFSFASLISFSGDVYLVSQISRSFQAETNFRAGLVSIGIRMPEVMTDDDGATGDPIKLTWPFTGTNITFDLGARYFIVERVSVKAAYRFELSHVDILKPMVSLSNNVVGTVALHF